MKQIGIIGCGERIRAVGDYVRRADPTIKVVALYDPQQSSVEVTQKFFDVPDATVYERWEDLVKDPTLDWIFIGSWNYIHAEQAIAAFKAGKNVFCEKPIAINVQQCLEMVKAQQESKVEFVVGFTLRFSPHYRKIKEILDSGRLGYLVSIELNETLDANHGGYIHGDWRRKCEFAGSHLLEKCCHDLDIINWFVNSKASKVASFGGCNFFIPENIHHQERIGPNEAGLPAFETWDRAPKDDHVSRQNPFTSDKDIIDNQVAIIEFENKVRATFHTNCCVGIPERRILICGSEGTLRADVMTGSLEVKRYGIDPEIVDYSTGSSGGHGGGDIILGQELAATINNGTPGTTTLMDGLISAFTAFAIDEAMYSNKIISMNSYWERLDATMS